MANAREAQGIVEPGAALDINTCKDWYGAIRPELGEEVVEAITAVIDRLRRSVDGSLPFPGDDRVRRVLMKRFPLQVVFRVKDKVVHVVAVRHTRRAPPRSKL